MDEATRIVGLTAREASTRCRAAGSKWRPGESEPTPFFMVTAHATASLAHAQPAEQRITRTNIRRSFQPQTPLLESGLLGPTPLVPGSRLVEQLHPS